MRTLAKYVALQVPGWFGFALLLWLVSRFWEVPLWISLGLFGAFLAKDALLYPFLRHAYGDAPSRLTGAESLLGVRGVADEDLAPRGWIRVRGERWRASLAAPGVSVRRGDPVIVREVRGLEVWVEPFRAQQSDDT